MEDNGCRPPTEGSFLFPLPPFSLLPALCLFGWKVGLGALGQHAGIVSERMEASPTQPVCSKFILNTGKNHREVGSACFVLDVSHDHVGEKAGKQKAWV